MLESPSEVKGGGGFGGCGLELGPLEGSVGGNKVELDACLIIKRGEGEEADDDGRRETPGRGGIIA